MADQTVWMAEKALDFLPLLDMVGGKTQALVSNPPSRIEPYG
jgi:hypothetical protein